MFYKLHLVFTLKDKQKVWADFECSAELGDFLKIAGDKLRVNMTIEEKVPSLKVGNVNPINTKHESIPGEYARLDMIFSLPLNPAGTEATVAYARLECPIELARVLRDGGVIAIGINVEDKISSFIPAYTPDLWGTNKKGNN